jgi:hypothetical protein
MPRHNFPFKRLPVSWRKSRDYPISMRVPFPFRHDTGNRSHWYIDTCERLQRLQWEGFSMPPLLCSGSREK